MKSTTMSASEVCRAVNRIVKRGLRIKFKCTDNELPFFAEDVVLGKVYSTLLIDCLYDVKTLNTFEVAIPRKTVAKWVKTYLRNWLDWAGGCSMFLEELERKKSVRHLKKTVA